ncbi:helix-turn-helix transcriptional regulator [Paenibacillus frigoriresistens]|uniref:helix-turn-helix transcriptional regulator n=1 Tax=Paenibacillus alginolyticus TaxID=59839 RepID=UPI001565B4AD|nr:AraC family transcriptional regulator [Paenibacillus frigoriresistens]NRF95978.1 helix-turn-helix transcriptional regulator [Paenibacillus frigoriresistens]
MKRLYLLEYEYLKSSPATMGQFQSHDNYEIFYFHEGKGNYVIGDKIHVLTPGTLIVMHGMTLHTPKSFDGYPYVRTLLNFDPGYFRAASKHVCSVNPLEPFEKLGNHKVQLNEQDREEFEELLRKMNRLYSAVDAFSKERFRVTCLEVLFFICQVIMKPVEEDIALPSEKEQHVQHALTYIENHYMMDICLDQLEGYLHINKYYLVRLFREVTGMTMFQYISKRRINQAKILFLVEPGKSVTDICYLTGFKNLSHFSKVFKQLEGITPDQYRRQLKSQL